MTQSVTVAYDRLALAAARKWRYTPATFNGVPVKYPQGRPDFRQVGKLIPPHT